MDYLLKKNPHYHDKYIKFIEKTHTYIIKGDRTYKSVTQFHKSNFKPFDSDEIIKNMMKSHKWKDSKYFGMTADEIKQSWNKNGKEASAAGTKMHYDIECFYNNIKNINYSKEFGYFNNFYEDHPNLKAYRTEWMIYDEKLKLAGSIDMVFQLPDGSFAIYDWKRCKNIEKTKPFLEYSCNSEISHVPDTNYWHYALQLNTYKAILERNYDIKISELHLVCLHPDNNNYLKYKVPIMTDEINILFQQRLNDLNN